MQTTLPASVIKLTDFPGLFKTDHKLPPWLSAHLKGSLAILCAVIFLAQAPVVPSPVSIRNFELFHGRISPNSKNPSRSLVATRAVVKGIVRNGHEAWAIPLCAVAHDGCVAAPNLPAARTPSTMRSALESCAAWNMRNPLEKISTDSSSHFFCLNCCVPCHSGL
jgi:hypothetical protein